VICPACSNDDGQDDGDEQQYLKLDNMYADNAMKREMSRLRVVCYFLSCIWSGLFKDFEDHMNTCEKRPVECSLCKQNVTSYQMSEHVKSHERDGKMCRFNCGQQVDEAQMKEHLMENIAEHFLVIFDSLAHLSEIVGPSSASASSVEQKSLTDRVTKIESHLTGNGHSKNKQSSTAAAAEGTTSKLGPAAVNGITTTTTAAAAVNGTQTEEKLKVYEAVLTVLNREVGAVVKDVEGLEEGLKSVKESLETQERKTKAVERQLAIKDATISELQLRITSLELTSYDGTLTWKITEFTKRRQEALSGRTPSFYSPPFYTSKTGYKMCVRMYLNGDGMGKGTHVSVFFVIMRGQYDAMLKWPFSQKVTLMFLDQNNKDHVLDAFKPDPTSSSFKRPTSEMNIASGCPHFLPLQKLDSTTNAYVKDDVAFLKIIVSPEVL